MTICSIPLLSIFIHQKGKFFKFYSLYNVSEAPDFRALLQKNRPYGQATNFYIGQHQYIGQYVVYHSSQFSFTRKANFSSFTGYTMCQKLLTLEPCYQKTTHMARLQSSIQDSIIIQDNMQYTTPLNFHSPERPIFQVLWAIQCVRSS